MSVENNDRSHDEVDVCDEQEGVIYAQKGLHYRCFKVNGKIPRVHVTFFMSTISKRALRRRCTDIL